MLILGMGGLVGLEWGADRHWLFGICVSLRGVTVGVGGHNGFLHGCCLGRRFRSVNTGVMVNNDWWHRVNNDWLRQYHC